MGRARRWIGAACWAGLVGSATGAAWAGAFNPKAGHGVILLTGTFSSASVFYDGYGRKFTTPGYSKFETQAHIEYGVTDWLAAIARPRVVSVVGGGSRPFERTSLGSSEFGAQALLWTPGSWSFAAQILARSPSAPSSSFEDRGGVEIRWMSGWSFSMFGMPAFGESHLALRTRGGRTSEAVVDSALGVRPTPKALVMLQTFVVQTLESPRRAWRRGAPLGSTSAKSQISLTYDLSPEWSVGAAYFRTIVTRDGAAEAGAALSLWRRF
jgi:hypothetical protein